MTTLYLRPGGHKYKKDLSTSTYSLVCMGSCTWDSHRGRWDAGGTEPVQHSSPGTAWSLCSAPQQRPEIPRQWVRGEVWVKKRFQLCQDRDQSQHSGSHVNTHALHTSNLLTKARNKNSLELPPTPNTCNQYVWYQETARMFSSRKKNRNTTCCKANIVWWISAFKKTKRKRPP